MDQLIFAFRSHMRLVENGTVSMGVVVHVDDIFSVGRKSRCDQFGRDLNQYVPITNLGELRLYAGCHFSRDFDAGTITILLRKAGVARVDRRLRRYYLIVRLLPNVFAPACLPLSSI